MNDYKIYNLSIKGIDSNLFSNDFYNNKCEKIKFNGIIHENKIVTSDTVDYITLAPKFKPHSDYEMMLQSTDSIVKSPITSLSDEATKYIFDVGYDYLKFISDSTTIKKYDLENSYPYLVFNYDEFTTDRHSGMSKKPFHLHLNSWKRDTISNIKEINKDEVSKYYYESVVDPIFDISRILVHDALDCDVINKYLKPIDIKCGNQGIDYSSVYKVEDGFRALLSDDFSSLLKYIHERLEKRYIEILKIFTSQDSVPKLYTRHILLPENDIEKNIVNSSLEESTKDSLIKLINKVQTITPEEFVKLSKDTDLRDSLIPLRWLAYSIGLFSNQYISSSTKYVDNDLYMNITPRLYTKIGGASIMNFPEKSLVKIDRGVGNISDEEFEKRMEFHKDFKKVLKNTRW